MHPVFIGVAWPYANGGLHLGHVAGSLLPPDIFRRFSRMTGHDTLMVSGSDCHGTPIMLKAEAEGKTPQQVVDAYHEDHVRALNRLHIGFDRFTRTTTANHEAVVQQMFQDCMEGGFIEKRTQQAPFDPAAGRFLPDRYVEGTCPHCNTEGARGDQCDNCGKTLDPQELVNPKSKLNPESAIEFRDTDHFFFLLSKLQPDLEAYVAKCKDHWRPNTINFTENWLREGLQDRAITRDLTWGVPIPLEGFDDKRIYVWFEAVCGYYSAAVEWAKRSSQNDWNGLSEGSFQIEGGAPPSNGPDGFGHWWTNPETQAYYFLGKDNIPFHTIIWPGILIAANKARLARGEPELVLPYDVPANEFLNLDGKQFSKSRGISIAVHDVLDRFDADAIRYYLAVNMPEQRDADWTWDDFLSKVNDELVGSIGNLCHRILSFAHKNVGTIPAPADNELDARIQAAIASCHKELGEHLSKVQLKKGIRRLLEFASTGNQLMQEAAPWKLLKEDRAAGEAALGSLLRLPRAMAVFLAPYVPAAADKLWSSCTEAGSIHDASWDAALAAPQAGAELPAPATLFRKLDKSELPAPVPEEAKKVSAPATEVVAFEDFQKIDLRIATVTSVEAHPKADRLYVLKLDVGDLGERQVVAGLKEHYDPADLAGQTVAFVANLAPVKLRGVESQGMILAGDDGETVAVLNPNRALPPGSKIR